VPLELLVELEIVVTGVQIEHVLVELNVVLEIEDPVPVNRTRMFERPPSN
jgi:hypothetical protein